MGFSPKVELTTIGLTGIQRPVTIEGEPVDYLDVIFIATGLTDRKVRNSRTNTTCQLRNASYSVDFTFVQGTRSVTISNLTLEPLVEFSQRWRTIDDIFKDGARAYLSMQLALETLLTGEIGYHLATGHNALQGANLPFVKTGLLACPEIIDAWKNSEGAGSNSPIPQFSEITSPDMCRNGSLHKAIQDLSHNFTLSLLSSSSFSSLRRVDVHTKFPMNYYVYRPGALTFSYLTALGVALACFAIGTWACHANGYSGSTTFSTIVNTTRNSQLDQLVEADCSQSGHGNVLSKTVKLQYGIFSGSGEAGHAAFGRADTVMLFRKR
jgi:hypothetical protein